MSIIYPDNGNRAQRCSGLANNNAEIFTHISSLVEQSFKANQQLYKSMNELLAKSENKTVETLYQDVLSAYSEEDRKKQLDAQKELTELNERLAFINMVSTALGGIGSIVGIAALTQLIRSYKATTTLVTGLAQATKQVGAGARFVQAAAAQAAGAPQAANVFQKVRRPAMILTQDMVPLHPEQASNVVRLTASAERLAKISLAVNVLALALTAGVLIYEAIDGAQRKEELQKATAELLALRLYLKHAEDQITNAIPLLHELDSCFKLATTYQELVNEGSMTQEKADKKHADDIVKYVGPVLKLPAKSDEDIWKVLQEQDKMAGAWTKEDPELANIARHFGASGKPQ